MLGKMPRFSSLTYAERADSSGVRLRYVLYQSVTRSTSASARAEPAQPRRPKTTIRLSRDRRRDMLAFSRHLPCVPPSLIRTMSKQWATKEKMASRVVGQDSNPDRQVRIGILTHDRAASSEDVMSGTQLIRFCDDVD